MSLRRRATIAAAAAVLAIGLGLVAQGTAPTQGAILGARAIATHGPRALAPSTTHGERRAPLERNGWVPAALVLAAGWVCIVSISAATPDRAAAPSRSRSRAPPT